MRQMNTGDVVTYSYTDDHVKFIARFSLLTGCLIGGVVMGILMSMFN